MLLSLFESYSHPSARAKVLVGIAVLLIQVGVATLAYKTGGAKFSILHLMYFPIIVAGLFFGTWGGLLAAVTAGVLIGPPVPVDTTTGEAQVWQNWLYRTFFFCMVGSIVGMGAEALRRQMRQLAWLSDHDALSGMLGRMGFLKTLRQVIAASDPLKELSVLVVNMNNFLDIQNTFGLEFGEQLLVCISDRWKETVPAGIVIAMVQPDRLAAVFPNTEEAQRLRPMIEARMREPYLIDGVPVYVNFTIGAARFPTHAGSAEEVLQKAGIAMHTALVNKQPFALYDGANDRTSRDNLILLGHIPEAILENQFAVWHQAKVALASNAICGTEALLRWQHPRRGMIPPGTFIPQAEETALINDLTRCVVNLALADMAKWESHGRKLSIAINMSVQNFHDQTLLDHLHDTTLGYGIDPERIEIEITESAVIADFDACITLISRLRNRGYRVAIDDFGTGHSSLAYLRRLPVTTLKIDQAFVKRLSVEPDDQKIVQTILNLARSFGLVTIAEGVENEATLALLREWGCDYAQGFALHTPMPFHELTTWLEAYRRD